MKLSVTIEGLASLPRFDAARLTSRLRAELERELQLSAVAELDPEQRRDALERALRRVHGPAR